MNVSVIIPAYNEEKDIADLLNALSTQTIIPDEIIVVDDGSTDNTVEIAKTYPNVKVIERSHEGVSAARHAGTLAATSTIIQQTDADIIPPPDWIERVIAHFEQDPDLIGLTGSVYDYKHRLFESITNFFASFVFKGLGANTAYKKEAYLLTPGYGSSIAMNQGEDVVLWKHLKKIGKCVYDPSLSVGHKSGYKWRCVGALIISGATTITGIVTRQTINTRTGDAIIGLGTGIAATEFVSNSVPLKYSEKYPEYSVNITGIHHDIIGVIALLITVILDTSDVIKNKELAALLYGISISIIIHHFVTEPEGCFEGICLNPINTK